MSATYSTSQAARLAGLSPAAIRNYIVGPFAAHYAAFFSSGACPPKGETRSLTERDLALIAFIREKTASGLTHVTIAEQIAQGALEGFTWTAAERADEGPTAPSEDEQAAQAPGSALVQIAATFTAQLAAAQTREQALYDRLIAAEQRAARAEGQLEAIQSQFETTQSELKAVRGELETQNRRRSWLARLFGG